MVPPSTIAFLVTFVLGLSRAQEKDLARIPAIGPWIYSGCANETPAGRTLNGPSISGNMTAERCLTFCTNQDYPLAGLEYGNECYCGSELQHNATYGQTGCNMACTAELSQMCGGSNHLSVYENSDYIAPRIVPIVEDWSSLGCFREGKTKRALSAHVVTDPDMTVSLCVHSCGVKGYSLAGVEYAVECYCGNDYTVLNQTNLVDSAECWMKCPGDKKTFCGGPDRLIIYSQSTSRARDRPRRATHRRNRA